MFYGLMRKMHSLTGQEEAGFKEGRGRVTNERRGGWGPREVRAGV